MKKISLIATICLMMSTSLIAQDLKPQKDKETKKYGYVNKSDEWVVKAIYDDADKFKDGVAKIYLNKKEGLISETGTVLVEPQFDDIDKFKDGLAIIKNNKKYGFIDKTGKVLCETKFDDIDKFSSAGLAIIKIAKKSGLIKNDGTVITQPLYDVIYSFYGNIANIQNNKLWGLIDITGKVIFEPTFAKALAFNKNGLSITQKIGEDQLWKFGLVKNDGSVILDCIQLWLAEEGSFFYVKNPNTKWEIRDNKGVAISKEFDDLNTFMDGLSSKYMINGLISAKEGNKWGFINEKGETIIPFIYDRIGSTDGYGFSNGYCAVQIGEKWGYIDKTGKYFKEPIFQEADRFTNVLGEVLSTVKMEDKIYTLNAKTGEMKLKPGTENNTRPVTAQKTQAATTQTTTAQTTTTSQAQVPKTSANTENDWLIGTWMVTEEKIGGKVKTGKQTTFVSYQFKKGGSGNYVERYDIMANQTQTKNMNWTLNGTSLKMSTSNYTLTPSDNKRTMTMNGPLGSSWKLTKQ